MGFEIQNIGGAFALEVQFGAHPEEKLVGSLEGFELIGPQVVLLHEVLEGGDVQFHLSHPEGVLVVPQPADSVFDIGLLDKNAVALLGSARRLILQPDADVARRVVLHVVGPVGGLKGLEKRLGPGHASRFE